MKHSLGISIVCLGLALGFTATQAETPPLRLETRTNAFDLVVDSMSSTGALFLYQAADLQTLIDAPSLVLQTNTPLTGGLRLPVQPGGGNSKQGFFSAAHWPGLLTSDFGDPENYPDEPPPEMVLVTAGLPDPLVAGQQFTVDFFLMDPAGHLLAVTQSVSIRVVRESDGVIHPDAQVSPATGQVVGGHLGLTLTVTASTSLEGYTLALGPAGMMRLKDLTIFLKTAFNITNTLTSDQSNQLYQVLETLRATAADNLNPDWAYPLNGGNYPVSGTFGEWRGDDNTRVHKGLDLAAPPSTRVLASRGGIVSHRGNLTGGGGMGAYVVVDHGDGWFSRYLHLQGSSIAVKVGAMVGRGDTLATNLYARAGWGTHLHFEIRQGANHSYWQDPFPGSGVDPLQITSINPASHLFWVPPGVRPPELEQFGLTRRHPTNYPFGNLNQVSTETSGPVYGYARFVDREPRTAAAECDPNYYRLSLRGIGFQPVNAGTINWIWPSNEVALANCLPGSGGASRGFARYLPNHEDAEIPQSQARCDYYRYWWQWDTSSYATNRSGPRNSVLMGVDYGGGTTNYTFTFGPQIKDGAVVLQSGLTYQFTNVAFLGTNLLANKSLADPNFSQPDQYKLEIIQTNGQPLPEVAWKEGQTGLAGSSPLSRVFAAHTNEQDYTFTLPSTADPAALKLRVSSGLVTSIAHEVPLQGSIPPGMVLIPAGSFTMGNCMDPAESDSIELPLHTVYVSAFYMDQHDVTKALWDDVYNWAVTHGYSFDNAGLGKAANHPVQTIDWYDCVKWCNARSEKEGRVAAYYTTATQATVYRSGQVSVDNSWVKWSSGYRLPTEAEWEKAARGGASGQRFPWGNTASWSQANYYGWPVAFGPYYDLAPAIGFDPAFNDGVYPCTSPVDYFAPNGYGLYDMSGNVGQWCWDWCASYSSATQTDPRGPAGVLSYRVFRGGDNAFEMRCAARDYLYPDDASSSIGFRCVRGL